MFSFFKNIEFSTVVGLVAGLLTSLSMLPQVIKTFKTKKAEEVSLIMLIILMSGIALWIWYGVQKKDYPIIITNSISMGINICMIYLRHQYKN